MTTGGGRNLGHAHGSISISTTQLEGIAPIARRVGQDTQQQMERMSAGVTQAQNSFQGLSNSVRRWAGVMGASLGAAGMVRLLQSSVAAASDLNESISKVGVAFADSGAKILAWSENSATALGQSRQQALEAASSFGLLLSTMGLAANESAEMSMALVQLATDIASINNISIEQALTALRSGLVGEVEPLRRVGVLLNAAAVEAKVLEMGLARTTKEITEQDKVMARFNLVMEQTTLTQGDFARTSGDLANRQRIAAAAAKDAQAAFGEVIQKDVIEATEAWTKALMALTTWIRNARAEAGGGSLGTALLQMGGWNLPGQAEAEAKAKKLNNELEIMRGNLRSAEEGLRVLQDQARMGLVDDAKVQSQIALVAQFTSEVDRLSGALSTVARIGSRGPNLASVSGTVARLAGSDASGGFAKQAELEAAQLDHWQAIQEIDRNAHSAIQDATEQYGQQRASTIAAHEKSMAREAEDFARQRARAVAAHEAQIARIRQDAAEREMQWATDMAERIAGMREDAARRIADWNEDHEERLTKLREDGAKQREQIEIDYARQRERAERAHRDTLLNAASRLDARAVAQEQRRFARESEEQAQAHAERLDKEQENLEERLQQEQEAHRKRLAREARDLQERIDQENRAHAKRIDAARKADEKRIADQQAAFAEQQAQEDEDRANRLARQRQDHADQLGEMARAQALRIQQIHQQQAEQRAKLNEAFEAQLADLGLFNSAWIAQQARWQRAATTLFNEMWGDWYKTMEQAQKAAAHLYAPQTRPQDFPSLLDFNSLPGGSTPAVSTSGRTTNINMAPGAIIVNEAHRPGQTGQEVEDAMIRLLERLN